MTREAQRTAAVETGGGADAAGPADAPGLKLRIDFAGGARIGPGKIDLLEAVARTGSITAAGRALGMSYRRAWLLLDALNRTFDSPVVATAAGGAGGGGAEVTAFGLELIAAYRALQADCAALAAARFGAYAARLAPDAPATDALGGD